MNQGLIVQFVFDGKVERIPPIGHILEIKAGHGIATYELVSYGDLVPVPEVAEKYVTREAVSLELNFNFKSMRFPKGTPIAELEAFFRS